VAVSADLSGKVILICGASGGGIGSAVTNLVAEAGGTVVAVDWEQSRVDSALADCEAKGVKAYGFVANLIDRAQASGVVEKAHKAFGRLDGVVNVAGGTKDDEWRQSERIRDEMIDDVMSLNFTYAFQVCRDAANVMIPQGTGGSIVNVASISGATSAPYHVLYGAAKAGVISITRSLAMEWRRYNIRVNAVSPGVTPGPRLAGRKSVMTIDRGDFGRRTLKSEEIANGALFLLSDAASGITAQNLVIDMGVTAEYGPFTLLESQARLSP
jgi:NAD(P)-dependent dehydrogenase (short-subunit alcohol dehydrogenase family)